MAVDQSSVLARMDDRDPITLSLERCYRRFRIRHGYAPRYFSVPQDLLLPLCLEWEYRMRSVRMPDYDVPVVLRDLVSESRRGKIRMRDIPVRIGTFLGAVK